MSNNNRIWTDPDIGALLLRIAGGGLLFLHGWHKVQAGTEDQQGMLADAGVPAFLMHLYILTEVIAPVLLVLGVLTRLSALSIVLTMVVIIYVLPFPIMATNQFGAWVIELQLFYLVVPLALFFIGPGRFRLWNNKSGNWMLD